MATKLYPIGMQTFSEIREEDFLYVDKTEYIYRMTHTSGKYFFLSRPRRFGKSLLVSTFESYFEGKKELFKGLAIEKLEKDWTEYPVLHLSLAGGKHMEKDKGAPAFSVKAIQTSSQVLDQAADGTVSVKNQKLTLIPYYAWNHRGANQMNVQATCRQDCTLRRVHEPQPHHLLVPDTMPVG